MDYRTLLVEIKHGVGIVWMNRPKQHNALNGAMIAELTAAMAVLDADPQVRVMVLAGAGESYCTGIEMRWLKRMAGCDIGQNRADAMNFATVLHSISTMKKPTIARVHGPVSADGVGLVAACDIAVAAYDAEFCFSEVRLGLIPATITPYVVRAMGERMARRYVLSAEPFTAAEAYRVGLVSDIAPLDELDARINELLGRLIQGGPEAQVLARDWIRTVAGAPITSALVEESTTRLAAVRTSEEGREGIRSILENRSPAWLGGPKKTAAKKKAPSKTKRTK
jgi:methylglutaconyl-CoA hydratase